MKHFLRSRPNWSPATFFEIGIFAMLILWALTLCFSCSVANAQRARRVTTAPEAPTLGVTLPDIVILVIDDVSNDDIDASIPQATTNLRALADQGVRFSRCYAHNWCAPTRDALLYSAWLGQHRGDDCDGPGPSTRPTTDFNIPKMLNVVGYNTAHFGKWHLGSNPVSPWPQTAQLVGYDHTGAYVHGPECDDLAPPGNRTRVDNGVVSYERAREDLIAFNSTAKIRNEFLAWWNATPSPRFATLNFRAAHAPFQRPATEILPAWYPPSSTDRANFEAEIASVDVVVGQLLPLLGPEDWFWFIGDNGKSSGAALPGQDPTKLKLTGYEGGINIPLIVRGPGVTPGLLSGALVHVVDFLPTIADILNVSHPTVDGLSFKDAMTGGNIPRHFAFSWGGPDRQAMAMFDYRWKLLTREDGVEELYDLSVDPTEINPMTPVGPNANYLRIIRDRILNGQSVLEW